ncbi:MAG: heparinase II/III family protein [Hyphomicrobium sp.]|nr:heparinase II/III family protein [Hyphomicrobium sp.]
MTSRLLETPMLRWAFRPAGAGQLLIVPQDLRTADPSFWQEMLLGQFGLAGTTADLYDASPFAVRPPNIAWERALHGFGWLRHLEAAQEPAAADAARRLAVEWIDRPTPARGVVWEPAVTARRVISWLSHSSLLLENAEVATYDSISQSLSAQVQRLAATWRGAADSHPRLLCLTAIVLADLCIDGHEGHLAGAEQALVAELDRQILADGGHISRNAALSVELLLDLLPLRQCFAARGRTVPASLQRVLADAISILRYIRMGDGRLARFNGVSVASPASLATVLAYDERPGTMVSAAPSSKYVRLERGTTIVVADAGSAPPLEFAGDAHAGCLSFELSTRQHLVIVNGGAPGPADLEWLPRARATASHNTLTVGETSSSRLVADRRLKRLVGSTPIQGPARVTTKVEGIEDAIAWTASHDGYVKRYGLVHHRRLSLSGPNGEVLEGVDLLSGVQSGYRLATDIPFAIHFHLHPEIRSRVAEDNSGVELETADGEVWRFSCPNMPATIEESVYFADSSGPRRALQMVLRGATYGETEVRWRLERRA